MDFVIEARAMTSWLLLETLTLSLQVPHMAHAAMPPMRVNYNNMNNIWLEIETSVGS